MDAAFLKLLNMSFAASWLVLTVVLLRLLLKKVPKFIFCILWAIVGLRLLLPFTVESELSVLPSSEVLSEQVVSSDRYTVNTGLDRVDTTINNYLDTEFWQVRSETGSNGMALLGYLWLLGVFVMLCYVLISYLRVRWQVRTAMRKQDNIWICDQVRTPFILGIFCPRIYLPSELDKYSEVYVLAHENAHLRRRDHWWKPLGFLLLCIHWFNPLIWLAYVFLCRDIEFACDARVIKTLGEQEKKEYSSSLLACSVPRRMLAACPLAFGEAGVKTRVRLVMNYKKPSFWIILVAGIACVAVAIGFLTNPKEPLEKKFDSYYDLEGNLELYAWEEQGEYFCGIMSFTNIPKSQEVINALPAATFEEMKQILQSYDLKYFPEFYDSYNTTDLSRDEIFTRLGLYENTELSRNMYPQYYDLDTEKGLDMYIWWSDRWDPEGEYYCGILPGNRVKSPDEVSRLERVPLREMSLILQSYSDSVNINYINMAGISLEELFTALGREQPEIEEGSCGGNPFIYTDYAEIVCILGNSIHISGSTANIHYNDSDYASPFFYAFDVDNADDFQVGETVKIMHLGQFAWRNCPCGMACAGSLGIVSVEHSR